MVMNVEEFQRKSTEFVKTIDKKVGRNHDIDTTLIHVMEELGEVSRIIYNNKTKRFTNTKEDLEGEFADTFMLLSHLATLHNIDLAKAFDDKFDDLKKRFEV